MTIPPRKLTFRIHAVRRMAQRMISVADVREAVESGETIERYPDDLPYPSRLILGWPGGKPLHVVAADRTDTAETIIITVYEPDPAQWDAGFKRRTT